MMSPERRAALETSSRGRVFGRALEANGHGLALGFAQRVGLGFAAALRHGFSEVGEENGEPEPQGDLQVEGKAALMTEDSLDEQDGGEHAADFHHQHDRVLHHHARVELSK